MFKLRKGVQFHNGKEMTADDVVASLNHHRGEGSKSAAKVYLASFADIKATAKDEVTITLAAGNADVPYILSDYHLLVMPADAAPDSAIGTGPYVKETFEPGVRFLAKQGTIDDLEDWQLGGAESVTQSSSTRSAEAEAIDHLPDSAVKDALQAIPEDFRLAVYFADVEGFSYQEIADIMKTPVGTVMSRLHRGRKLLHRKLGGLASSTTATREAHA